MIFPSARVLLVLAALAAQTAGPASAGGSSQEAVAWPLRWPAPALEAPETVRVGRRGANLRLASGRDYRIVLDEPVRGRGGLKITGGRNVVIRGGRITIPAQPRRASIADRRALLVAGQTGTVHLEGILIDNSGGDLSEGIQIAAPKAVVQIQNVRVDGVHARDEAGFSDNHPDAIQPWGGVRALRVHRFTARTRYQGIFLKPSTGPIGAVALSKVNIVGVGPARYLLWKHCPNWGSTPCRHPDFRVRVRDTWVRPARGRSLGATLRPGPSRPPWNAVQRGLPPGGPFVTRCELRRRYARTRGAARRPACRRRVSP